MTPKAREPRSAGDLEDSCTRRKRSRRVSFAETTVHVFKRDDESESPANSTPVPGEGVGHSDNEETVGFRGIQSQGDYSAESCPEDDGENGVRLKFVRDVNLSSPGSAVGSVTSNEDDNFFGPISTSFINSSHLSEPGMPYDNNHDITLDSTAFSLHFRNIAPPDDQSANSAGSLRTPTGDATPTIPVGFLVGGDQTEELSSKCSVGQLSNVSGDNISLNKGGCHSYDYGKLSLTLEALMDEVNLRMQQKSLVGDCIISISQTDEIGGIRKPRKDEEEVSNQNSCDDEPGSVIRCSVFPIGSPTINESLLHAKAKAKALTSYSNSEKIKEMFSTASADRFGKDHGAVCPEVVITNGENSKLLSLSQGELQNDLNEQGCHVHQELFKCTRSKDKSYPDSFPSVSDILSISDDGKEKFESVTITHSPENATTLFHTSAPPLQEIKPSSHGQEQQQFLSLTVPSSTNFFSLSARKKLACRMETPNNAVKKTFQFSTFNESTSSFKVKQTQPLNFYALSQSELMHDAGRQHSDSLVRELMEHGERISAIKNHITISNVKSRMQSDFDPAPSSKDLFVTAFQSTPKDIGGDRSMKRAGIYDVNVGTTKINAAEHLEGMDIIRDHNCSGNISCLTKPDQQAALESMDIIMKTPDNAVKAFRLSALRGSLSSYQDKQKKLQYRSIRSQCESLHSPARELSACLKMELREHGDRISAIKTSITQSRFKSKMPTDCETAPLMKDLFITNLQGYLNEINDDPYMKHARVSDENINANGVTAVKQVESLDIVKDLNSSRNSSLLTGLDKNVALMETVGKGQSEECIEFSCDSSLKLPHTLDLSASSIDQREADLKESNDISSTYALANKEKSTIALKGCVTSVHDVTSSRDLLERKSLQPAASLVSPVEKVSNGKKLKVTASSGTFLHYGKTGIDSKSFHVGGLCYGKKLNENSTNRPKKVIERSMIDPYEAPGEVLKANSTLRKSLENTESQQETYCGYDVAVVGAIGNKLTCHIENAGYSESYRMQNSPANVPDAIGDSVILSIDHMHPDKALDIEGMVPLKHVFSKLCDSINHLLPQSISELSLQKLDDLENLLDELQTARNYEGLCITLRNKECCAHPYQKRVIDARFLLENLGIAKARKQLKCLKLKSIRNKAQILQSQVEECDKLMLTYAQLRDLCTRVVESDESSYCEHQVHDMKLEEQNRLMAMKQELGILEQNIKLLLKSFEASCKITGKMSCSDVIKAVDEHVMRRAFCKEIQQHSRLWKLCELVMENDHYEITLGYCNLLFQRFTLSKSRFSSIIANIFSDSANIIKKYPNMNACLVFEFVFKLNVDQKFANSNCIYERTVETNLFMGTLIDVLEEILLSRLELLNLIFSTFLKQSSRELELQLCFYSSSSGRKLVLGVDMTSLNCGIYPSELKLQVCEQQTTLPSSIVSKAIAAVRSLECGHLMILRLCRCVSQVIHFST